MTRKAERGEAWTVGRLARRFGLSRSTLLYYDSIGLLKPSGRSEGGYRIYTEKDAERLSQICSFRKTGLSLEEMKRVLDSPRHSLAEALEKRLIELNGEIEALREQQKFILGILRNPASYRNVGVMNKETWVSILAASGFDEEDMARWHVAFERASPEKHRRFLEFLCIPEEELEEIISRSREACGRNTDD